VRLASGLWVLMKADAEAYRLLIEHVDIDAMPVGVRHSTCRAMYTFIERGREAGRIEMLAISLAFGMFSLSLINSVLFFFGDVTSLWLVGIPLCMGGVMIPLSGSVLRRSDMRLYGVEQWARSKSGIQNADVDE